MKRGADYYMKKPYNLENIISFYQGTKFNIYQIYKNDVWYQENMKQ